MLVHVDNTFPICYVYICSSLQCANVTLQDPVANFVMNMVAPACANPTLMDAAATVVPLEHTALVQKAAKVKKV